jgi:multidrug efflux pump
MKRFNLSEWSLKHPSLVLYLIIALMISGFYAYTRLGRAEDPDFTFKIMVLRAYWPGATAHEVEQQVTDRLEKKLQETPWLDYLHSYSKPGEALIFVHLRDYTPKLETPGIWYQVRKKVSDIRDTLPQGVRGPYFNDEFGDTFGNIYAFTADGFSHAELRDYVEKARQEVLRVEGVGKVELLGVQPEKIYVEISHKKLASLGIDPMLLASTLEKQNTMSPAGSIETGSDLIHLRVSGDFQSVESIRDIGLRANGRSFRLGDIARVYRGYADPPAPKVRFMGQETIALAISMAKGGNVLALGDGLNETMRKVQQHLPVGIEVHRVSDQPGVVKRSINEFMESLLIAVVIVLAVSFISLGLRTGLVVALSIPLTLAVTFLLMWLFGIDLQRISLGALIISLGLLVDDAIISVEMMAVKMEQGWDRMKAASFTYTSTAFPMLTGTLITAAGFLPVGFAKSTAGEYTFSIFAVVGLALMVSWIVAVVFTPYLGFKLLPDFKAHPEHGQEVYQKRFYVAFRKLVTWCVTYRKTVILITLAVFVLSIFGFRFIEQQFFPSSNRPELIVDLWLPDGSSLKATEHEVEKLEKQLAGDKNIVNFVCYVGNGSPRFYLPLDQQLAHNNFAQFVVMAKDKEVREVVRARLLKLFQTDFQLLRGRVSRLENGPPVGFPVQFRVLGPDTMTLRKIGAEVAEVMRANPHIRDVHPDWGEMSKVVKLDVDQDKARALGITSQELSTFLNSLLSGFAITSYRERDQLIEVMARAESEERLNPATLKDINIYTHDGRHVPLAQIARIHYEFEEGIVWRRNRVPVLSVRADVVGNHQAPTVTKEIEPQLESIRKKLPPGYSLETGGTVEESAKAEASIKAVVPMMLIVVMTLLMIQLQSFRRTLLVLLTAPLGLIGVVLSLLVFQLPFGFVANLGFIALGGMIMRNSVILVDQIEQDIQTGRTPWEAIIESAVRRFRPIMLTAAAAILAMIPLTFSTFWGPMAAAIMGGLFVATLLTLLFVPALYAVWFRVKRPG